MILFLWNINTRIYFNINCWNSWQQDCVCSLAQEWQYSCWGALHLDMSLGLQLTPPSLGNLWELCFHSNSLLLWFIKLGFSGGKRVRPWWWSWCVNDCHDYDCLSFHLISPQFTFNNILILIYFFTYFTTNCSISSINTLSAVYYPTIYTHPYTHWKTKHIKWPIFFLCKRWSTVITMCLFIIFFVTTPGAYITHNAKQPQTI